MSRPSLYCEHCGLLFISDRSFIDHKTNYCYKRRKLSRSCTVTTQRNAASVWEDLFGDGETSSDLKEQDVEKKALDEELQARTSNFVSPNSSVNEDSPNTPNSGLNEDRPNSASPYSDWNEDRPHLASPNSGLSEDLPNSASPISDFNEGHRDSDSPTSCLSADLRQPDSPNSDMNEDPPDAELLESDPLNADYNSDSHEPDPNSPATDSKSSDFSEESDPDEPPDNLVYSYRGEFLKVVPDGSPPSSQGSDSSDAEIKRTDPDREYKSRTSGKRHRKVDMFRIACLERAHRFFKIDHPVG